ncbi:MAG: Protein TolR [Pseudomonadota bacterium]|jgi:biopolymer transport protein TolR
MAGNVGMDNDGPIAAINVTPLVDVMLVLLVIFMVTAPMMQQGVEVDLPKATTAPLRGSSEQIVISLDKAGSVFLGAGNKVELTELADKVKAIFANKPENERKIYIKGDSSLGYGRIMDVMAALHAGGITQIGLVSASPEGKG